MTPMIANLLKPLDEVIASKRISLIKKLMGNRVFDALCHMPSQFIQKQHVSTLTPELIGAQITIPLTIQQHFPSPRRGSPYRILTVSPTSKQVVEIVLFSRYRSYQYLQYRLAAGKTFSFTGKLENYSGQFRLTHPKYNTNTPFGGEDTHEIIYPLTAGLTSTTVGRIVSVLLSHLKERPDWHFESYNYPGLMESLRRAHNPHSQEDLTLKNPAKARLLHDEILAHNLSLKINRLQTKSTHAPRISCKGHIKKDVLDRLPFKLTAGQEKALKDIEMDLSQNTPMLRLIQGDVGCGKTIVAAAAMAQVMDDGLQTAVLVPTDILSKQHFENFKNYFAPLGIRTELLTGKIIGAKRKKILEDLANGEISILIGTHALIQEGVEFKHLGLVIVDEQHRFGVEQRAKLVQKGYHPHVLSMTATPIPRTLLMTNYGDVDLSIIKEKPAERQPIKTTLHPTSDVDSLIKKLLPTLHSHNKAYWVCPLIEESEKSDYAAAKMRFNILKDIMGNQVGLLHGKMKSDEKQAVMDAFKHGDIHMLVSTTVIEVGVDVRTANIMIIEHAERFGLAQLHQLRGRVGRSDQKANCLLLYEKLTPIAKERLSAMRDSNDGFYLADADLKLRGGGDVTGYKQSGFPDFKFYKGDDFPAFETILERVRDDVQTIITSDPHLISEQGLRLRDLLELYEKKDLRLITQAA